MREGENKSLVSHLIFPTFQGFCYCYTYIYIIAILCTPHPGYFNFKQVIIQLANISGCNFFGNIGGGTMGALGAHAPTKFYERGSAPTKNFGWDTMYHR